MAADRALTVVTLPQAGIVAEAVAVAYYPDSTLNSMLGLLSALVFEQNRVY